MIEQILKRRNLLLAMKRVQKNRGSAGIDHMPVTELSDLMSIDKEELSVKVRSGEYLPQAILGAEIPKTNGKKRLLGIPTVTDRLLQQAVSQILAGRFEGEFSNRSYGFRPKKNMHHAVLKAQDYIQEGYATIVDIDLKNFFDEVEHRYLLELVYRKVKCRVTLRLIRKWLRAPIQIGGKLTKRRKGIPQGSPLSPLLSNIMLHELDRKLEAMNYNFVRYADDFSVYTKSKEEAEKAKMFIEQIIKQKLKLKVNEEKSGIRRPTQFTILGFGFVPVYKRGSKGLTSVWNKNGHQFKIRSSYSRQDYAVLAC